MRSPLPMYSGTWISMPVDPGQPRRLRPLGGGAALELGRGLDHFQGHARGSCRATGSVVDHLHEAAFQPVGDVAGGVADHVGIEQVLACSPRRP
jgi:hypothetical protein